MFSHPNTQILTFIGPFVRKLNCLYFRFEMYELCDPESKNAQIFVICPVLGAKMSITAVCKRTGVLELTSKLVSLRGAFFIELLCESIFSCSLLFFFSHKAEM